MMARGKVRTQEPEAPVEFYDTQDPAPVVGLDDWQRDITTAVCVALARTRSNGAFKVAVELSDKYLGPDFDVMDHVDGLWRRSG
jgi:mRNA-degrading endonuclease toxin of MazEF toxin-antitoxin module